MTPTILTTGQEFYTFLTEAGFRLESGKVDHPDPRWAPWYRRGQVRVIVEDAEGCALAIHRLGPLDGPDWSMTVSHAPTAVLSAVLAAAGGAS